MSAPWHVQVYGSPPHIRSVVMSEGDAVFVAVVEANLKQPEAYRGGDLDAVVAEAKARLLPPLQRHTASAFAQFLSESIMLDAGRWRRIGAVFYAGVVGVGDTVVACTAGDIRVHVLRENGSVLAVSRDHNAVSDDEEGVYRIAEGTTTVEYSMLQHVPTRALPPSGKGLECWDSGFPANGRIAICSSVVHNYQTAESYVSILPEAMPQDGFAVLVGRSA